MYDSEAKCQSGLWRGCEIVEIRATSEAESAPTVANHELDYTESG